MGLFVAPVGVTPLSLMTFGEAKRKVAAVVSLQADDPNDVGAGDAITDVLREFNGHRWDYLTVQAPDIVIVDSTGLSVGVEGYRGQYTIPTPLRDFVSAKIDFSGQTQGGTPLVWIARSMWDRINESDGGQAGTSGQGTRYITDFQTGITNKIELLDYPTKAGRLELRYFRPITIPNENIERMDLPRDGPLEAALIYKARALVAMDVGVRSKATFYEAKGERAFRQALGVDRWKYMHDSAWKPRHEIEQNWPAEAKRFGFYGTWGRGR